jgi:hypothetical protein
MPRFLLRDLAISGARGDDDAPVASGFVTLYELGTTALAPAYVDESGDETFPQPVLLDETGKATIWVDRPVRMLIQTAALVMVFDGDPADTIAARAVSLENPAWPGVSNVDGMATALGTSVGGDDGKYGEAPGGVDRDIHTHLGELSVSVKAFGATGNGLDDDRDAIIAAYTYITQHTILGARAELYFPAGAYRMSTQLSILVNGVRLRGAGKDISTIEFFGADSNGIVATGIEPLDIEDLTVKFDGFSLGTGIDITDSSRVHLERVRVLEDTANGFEVGCRLLADDRDCVSITFEDCDIEAPVEGATDTHALQVAQDNPSFVIRDVRVLGGRLRSGHTQADLVQGARAWEFDGVKFEGGGLGGFGAELVSADGILLTDCDFSERVGTGADIKVDSSTDNVRTWANTYSASNGLEDGHAATDLGTNNIYGDLSQNPVGNWGTLHAFAAPATFTPNLDKGNFFKLSADPGVIVTIAAPTTSFYRRPGQHIAFLLAGDSAAFTFNVIYVGFSSAVRGVQTGTWDGTSWVADTPNQDTLQSFPVATGGSVTPVAGGVVVITVTGGGPGDVDINAPTGAPATGARMVFILKGHDDLTAWNWNAIYHEEARYADDTASGLATIVTEKTGAVGVVTFFYDEGTNSWCLEHAARDGAGAARRPNFIDLHTDTAPATVTCDRTLTDIIEIQATGDGGVGTITINPPTVPQEGSRMRFLLAIVGTNLFSWTLNAAFVIPDAEDQSPIATEADGWPLVAGKMGIIDWVYWAGKWRKVSHSGILTT